MDAGRRIGAMSISDVPCLGQKEVLAKLQEVSPDAPLLALGQTVLWDEPMKAGVANTLKTLGIDRKFIAGIHDTDYFARHPGAVGGTGYQALAHNDTTTQALWSAAAEFSALFGSETVIRREWLQDAGIRLGKIARERPGILERATEAFGWRGIASMDNESQVIAEVLAEPLVPQIRATLGWAIDRSLECLAAPSHESMVAAQELRKLVVDAEPGESLSAYFARILPDIYNYCSSSHVDIQTTRTTELLKFNTLSCQQDRFEILGQFLDPLTKFEAMRAYNETVEQTEMYTLDRFGSWAIPFDLVVPGQGRGTLRIAPKAVVIMTPKPLFITLKKPITSVRDLADAIERKFGPDCVLVGKALTLIGMLAREFVFVFHETASSYVNLTQKLHQKIYGDAPEKPFHPILRVRYSTWDEMSGCCTWIKLPEPLRQPFGVDETCAPGFSSRWRTVVTAQTEILAELSGLRSPLQFIRWLAQKNYGIWCTQAIEYENLHDELLELHDRVQTVKKKKQGIVATIRQLKAERQALERAKGDHFRAKIFEKSPTDADLAERLKFGERLSQNTTATLDARANWADLDRQQRDLVRDDRVMRCHDRRRQIELEAELERLKIARNAITVSKGLPKAAYRPSAWWFRLVCPTGGWFERTTGTAAYYLESLL